MKDYYKTLGLEKNASKDDIKKAFRKMAHEHHPDKNEGNTSSEQKFKEASEAYSVLSDDNKRAQYDRFGSAGPGGTGFNSGQGGFGAQGFGGFDFSQFQQGGGFHFNQGGVGFDLGEFFGGGSGGRGRRPRKGANITVDMEVSFKDSIFGVEKEISVNNSKFSIKIPPGIESGQGLRVAGKGEDGPSTNSGQGTKGDLIVRIWVKEHPVFRKEAFNLIMDLPIRLTLALTGGSVDIEALEGKLEVKIPAGTSHGEILRVKGKGVPYETTGGIFDTGGRRGDLLIVTHVEMPKRLSKRAKDLIDELKGEGV